MKQQLTDQVKTYTDAFAQWIESTGKIARGIAIISAETRQMLPAADEIIAVRRTASATQAADGVAASQAADQDADHRHRRRGRAASACC